MTKVEVLNWGTRITLPSGHVVLGAPQDSEAYRDQARRLGYDSTLAMCQDHDPLHVRLCEALGLESFSLRQAAGILPPELWEVALAEEEAVLAVQKFMTMARSR